MFIRFFSCFAFLLRSIVAFLSKHTIPQHALLFSSSLSYRSLIPSFCLSTCTQILGFWNVNALITIFHKWIIVACPFRKKAVGCTHLPYAYRKPLEKTNALSISFSKSLSDQLLRCCASLERVCFVAVVELSSSKLVAFLLRRIIGDGVLKARLLSISAILIVRSFASKWLAQAAQAQASASVVRWCDCSQQSQVLQAQAFEYDASEIK